LFITQDPGNQYGTKDFYVIQPCRPPTQVIVLTFIIAQERQATSVVIRFLRSTTNTPSMSTRPLCDQVCEISIRYEDHSLTSKSEEKAKPVKEAFPQIKIALGGLGDSELLEKEAAKADVVIRTPQ
jgi:hypothetical protein